MKNLSPAKVILFFAVALLVSLSAPGRSFGGDRPTIEELQRKLNELEKQVAEYRALIEEYSEENKAIKKKMGLKVGKIRARKDKRSVFALPAMPGNFSIGANITGIVQGSPNTRLAGEGTKEKWGGSYQANVTLTNVFEGVDGLALANLRIGEGTGLNDQLTVYSNVDNNFWADDHFTLSELFYEQHLFEKKVFINFGKLDPTVYTDLNKYADSDTTQFLGMIFNNSPVIEFPYNSGGIRLGFFPFHWLELDYLVMSGRQDLRDLGSHLFNIGQMILKPKINEREGNYSFLVWHNNNDHRQWDNPSETDEGTYGLSVSCDQEVTDVVGVFGKFGWQNPKVYNPDLRAYPKSSTVPIPNIEHYSREYMWNAGIQVKGRPWGRVHDFFGVGIGQVVPSGDMEEATGRKAKNEGHFEAYYNFWANKYLSISPGVQLIWNAYGDDTGADSVIAVYTLRTHVDF